MRTQFTTRLPEPLASALAAQAQANHRSANAELTAILRDALSGTPSTPTGRTQDNRYPAYQPMPGPPRIAPVPDLTQDQAEALLAKYRSAYHGLIGMDFAAIEDRTVAHFMPDLAPYKAALQRLIDDSAALREKYEDLDEAVEQAQKLLHT